MSFLRVAEIVAPGIARIPLTQGYSALVDQSDLEKLGQRNWTTLKGRGGPYAVRYERRGGRSSAIFMHRELVGATGEQPVDHRNGDTLDNRRGNLRSCTCAENVRNRRAVRAKSGFKGVYFRDKDHVFEARIKRDGKNHYLGSFKLAIEAAAAYDKKAVELFGEFAATNQSLGLLSRSAA